MSVPHHGQAQMQSEKGKKGRRRLLAGKSALVSGGAGGIGLASARLLARDGAAVLLMGRRRANLAEARSRILDEIPSAQIGFYVGDACVEADVAKALQEAYAVRGRLDMLVATVGGGSFKPLLLEDGTGFVKEFERNVISAFYMVKRGVPLMNKGGAVVCISSTAGVLPFPGLSAYSTAKAALEMFIRVAADELGSAQIRINGVRPGLTRSEGTAGIYADDNLVKLFTAEMPLGRTGACEDIAQAVRYLAGPESAWLTGQSFAVDGGQELRRNPNLGQVMDGMFGKQLMDQVRAGRPPIAVD